MIYHFLYVIQLSIHFLNLGLLELLFPQQQFSFSMETAINSNLTFVENNSYNTISLQINGNKQQQSFPEKTVILRVHPLLQHFVVGARLETFRYLEII